LQSNWIILSLPNNNQFVPQVERLISNKTCRTFTSPSTRTCLAHNCGFHSPPGHFFCPRFA
jgi:hypothetical protein